MENYGGGAGKWKIENGEWKMMGEGLWPQVGRGVLAEPPFPPCINQRIGGRAVGASLPPDQLTKPRITRIYTNV